MSRRAALAAALLLVAGCGRKPATTEPQPPPVTPIEPERVEPVTVTLWFPEESLEFLESELRDVPAQADSPAVLAEAVVTAVLEGPQEPGHERLIPTGVRVNKVVLTDGLATVDLSADFIEKYTGGSNVAALAVYSLVNSLCELNGIDKVKLTFDGKPGGEFAGVLDLSAPLEPDPSLNGAAPLEPDKIQVEPEPELNEP